jgi:hypothetical protein
VAALVTRDKRRGNAVVTLAEVARRAKVTGATVSNVLRNPQKVKPETVERVMAAIRELGYRPNLTARALARGRTSTLALMLSNIANPFYPEFVLAAEREARKRGYFLLVCNTDDDPAITRAYLEQIAGSLASGVIVMNTDLSESELTEIASRGVSPRRARSPPRIYPGSATASSARWWAPVRAARRRFGWTVSPARSPPMVIRRNR